ncbi:MAG: 2-phosphosulfolactate phosphatase [Bacteroidetes bacterium HGW-Bacteroidetes-6]|jgi:2-phosphosulfolactate phosphatase|nr:MAG: 2-phosphosulfolactate phosphatase [Bacteroidetes bacterium HGW-Bacteroidetes-6]
MNTIEVCFTPALYQHILTEPPFTVAVVDILRATTSICSAFQNHVKEIIPVATTEEAMEYKNQGFLIAAERNGIKLDFADFGNSPDNFMTEQVRGRSIVYSTTNGTQTIKMVNNGCPVVIASFINLTATAEFIASQNQNAVILCAGWKQKFNLEDSLFAGALSQKLLELGMGMNCDSAQASLDLWNAARENPIAYIQKAMHRERLKKLNLDSILEYCFTPDQTDVVPVFDGFRIVNKTNHE